MHIYIKQTTKIYLKIQFFYEFLKKQVQPVWSILANPTSKIRWEAVHIVYRLVELNCNEVIDSMIAMFRRDDIGAFGSTSFPFYKFHAQLYFMIKYYFIL